MGRNFLIITDPHQDIKTRYFPANFAQTLPVKIDAVLCAGDWGIFKTLDTILSFGYLREAFPEIPIYGVLGNHDLWDEKNYTSIEDRLARIQSAATDSNIHLLENNPLVESDLFIGGFNGWYGSDRFMGETRDSSYILPWVGDYNNQILREKEAKAVSELATQLAQHRDKKKIVLTHFPCIEELIEIPSLSGNTRAGELLYPCCDLFIYGHSHKAIDTTLGTTRIINPGCYRQYQIVTL